MEPIKEENSKECCSKNSCGCGGGYRKSCCGGKALAVIVIFLLGGIIGYLMGKHCSYGRKACMMGMMGAHCPVADVAK